jgi:hypothetical protein
VRSLAAIDDGNRTSLLVLYENNTKIKTSVDSLRLIEHAATAVGRGVRTALVDLGPDPTTSLPRFSSAASVLGKRVASGWGYYKMCNFFFSDIFWHPALADAAYLMRLDTDSCFMGRCVPAHRSGPPGLLCPQPPL